MPKEQIHICPEEEKGKLGICYLKKIWSCAILERKGLLNMKDHTQYSYVSAVFSSLGIGIEPTYQYLFKESPSFDAFEDWIVANGNISIELVAMFNRAILNFSSLCGNSNPTKQKTKITLVTIFIFGKNLFSMY